MTFNIVTSRATSIDISLLITILNFIVEYICSEEYLHSLITHSLNFSLLLNYSTTHSITHLLTHSPTRSLFRTFALLDKIDAAMQISRIKMTSFFFQRIFSIFCCLRNYDYHYGAVKFQAQTSSLKFY